MTFGSLFAGIGGFDLGFERAGMVCKWQVEINEFCRKVLAKHWPPVHRHDDVRTFPDGDAERYRVDVICGGFPCQDISRAGRVQGKRDGIDGKRSGLWSDYARIIRVLRPRFVVVENSAEVLNSALGRILGDVAEIGFNAEWHCIPAAAFGAPHIRDRAFILAYPDSERFRVPGRATIIGAPPPMQGKARQWSRLWTHPRAVGEIHRVHNNGQYRDAWCREPNVGRLAYGVSDIVEQTRAYGNAVVPQVAEWIGRRIMEHAKQPQGKE